MYKYIVCITNRYASTNNQLNAMGIKCKTMRNHLKFKINEAITKFNITNTNENETDE